MAATLCKWIFVKPCEACGKCCDEFAKCMGDCCRPIYECCRPCCDYMEDFFDRPFAFTLSFVFCIVFAPAVALIALSGMAFGNTDPPVGCQYGNMPMWGVVFAVESFLDFAVAIYIFCKFNEPYDFNNPKDRNYSSRMQRLLCEDVVVALYICILIFKFVWLIMGSVWSNDATLLPCPNGFSTMIDCMTIFGYIFFGVGAALIVWHMMRYSPCCLACFPEESQQDQQARQLRLQNKRLARQNRRNGNHQPVVQNMNRQQAPGVYQQAPAYHPNPHQSHQLPVATAQPVYNNNQRGAVQQIPNNNQPQVVVHQPARTANANNTGAAKKEESSTASKLFGRAKGLFGR